MRRESTLTELCEYLTACNAWQSRSARSDHFLSVLLCCQLLGISRESTKHAAVAAVCESLSITRFFPLFRILRPRSTALGGPSIAGTTISIAS